MLREGGTLVYSTCSLEPEEDEGMVSGFLSKHDDADLKKIALEVKHKPGLTSFEGKEYDDRVKETLRMWPQDNDTEGFFVAKIVKT